MGAGTSLISSGAGATVSTAMGIAMYYEGKKMQEKAEQLSKTSAAQRPTYVIPESMQQYLTSAQKTALQGMDEQSRQRYLDQIARNASYAISANVDRSSGLQGVSAANTTMNEANANLMIMDEQQRRQNQAALQAARLNYAGYEDKAFAYNKDQPYQDMAAAIRALKAAGEQAKYAGAQTVANAGTTFAGQAGSALQSMPEDNTENPSNKNIANQQVKTQQPQTYTPYAGPYAPGYAGPYSTGYGITPGPYSSGYVLPQ
jgi:hypothetical protein